jgi:hypothetical protein
MSYLNTFYTGGVNMFSYYVYVGMIFAATAITMAIKGGRKNG